VKTSNLTRRTVILIHHRLVCADRNAHLVATEVWNQSQSQSRRKRRLVGQSVMVSEYSLVRATNFSITSMGMICRQFEYTIITRRPPVVRSCSLAPPGYSFSDLIHAGLITIFYFLDFEISLAHKARFPCLFPTGTAWPSYTREP
jgi:hypothetical protein